MADDRFAVEVDGAKELRRKLKRFEHSLADLRPLHLSIASPVAQSARQAAPRKSGALAATIRPTATRQHGEVRAGNLSRGKHGKGVVYAPIHEYGNAKRNIRPQYYLRRTTALWRPRIAASYEKGITALMRLKGLVVE